MVKLALELSAADSAGEALSDRTMRTLYCAPLGTPEMSQL